MANATIIIKLSKTKIMLLGLGSVLFVLASIWILSFADQQNRYDPKFLTLICYISILLFSTFAIYGFIKLFDKKPGLVINREGIIDNSSAISGQLIKWENIASFEVSQIQKTRFLLIFVNNPEHFINGAGRFKKALLKMNAQMYGTPLSISAASLDCNFDELVAQINAEWEIYQRKQ